MISYRRILPIALGLVLGLLIAPVNPQSAIRNPQSEQSAIRIPQSNEAFSLEQILSSPFPSDLVASRQGNKVAWVFDAQGKRNVWIAEPPEYRGRQLTRYDKDDGQEITDLVFSPDGNSIAYVRGGPKNQAGEIPNPTSDPSGARQEIWLVAVRAGNATKLAEGNNPVFSPSGDRVIFNRDSRLWMAPVRGGGEKKLFEIRGEVASPSWSADGTRLVFVSSREDHSFIAVYDVRKSQLWFVEPGVDRDIQPRWSPDGKKIAFIRLFNVENAPSADRERLAPWSIWVVDAESGRGTEVWKSGRGEMDSFPNFPGGTTLQWVAGNRLLFGSEKDGWYHLYLIGAESRARESGQPEASPGNGGNGAQPLLLTPGNYEVENVALSSDRKFLVVASNAGDIDRRHLWKIDLSEMPLSQQITKGESIELQPVILSGGKIAFLHATARNPLLPYVTSIDGTNSRPLSSQTLVTDFPAAKLVEPEQVIFKAADGTSVHGQLFKPPRTSGKAPAMVYMHGGPPRQMLLGWHYMYYYHNAYGFNQYLASRGYLVLSVNYRSGIGYGRAFREARRRGARGASEYQDIVAAGKYLRSRSDVDPKRIGLWGGSYGGYLTAMGLARDSELFAAGVDLHGVHDWGARVGRTPRAGDSPESARLARESSPITSVDKWKSPVLLIHGDDDRNVAFNQTVELVRKLREKGVTFEQLVFPDEVHDFLRHEHWLQAYHAAADFFDRYLK